jgi:hypothetical protein
MPLIDTKAQTNDQGFTPEEQAELDAAEQENVPVEGEEVEEQPESEPEPVAEEKPTKAAPQATERAKPPAGFVPQSALHEARQQAQEARERAARLEGAWAQLQDRLKPQQQQQSGPAPAQVPDFNVDPIGNLQGQLAQAVQTINELKGHTQKTVEQQQQQAQYNQFVDAYRSDVSSYAREAPDFGEAYRWLEQEATREIEARYPGITAQDVQSILVAEEERIVANAFRNGRRPAQVVYEYAKARGYKKPAPAPEENKLERLKAGQKAAASLGSAKGAGKQNGVDNMTLEAYAELMESDPAKADQMWPALAKRGLFG